MKLASKVSIVTGGGKGIGYGISLRLGQEGSKVVIAQRDPKTGEDTVRCIIEAGGEAIFVPTDVSVKSQVDNLVEQTLLRFGQIDVLVNNAAITGCSDHFLEITPERWQQVIGVNLTGVFFCSQAVARYMVQRRYGRIINIGSVGAVMPEKDAAHYCAAKGGLDMLTKAMALDLAPYKILVNAVHPGAIRTPQVQQLMSSATPDAHLTATSKIPLGRFGEVEEVAAAVAFLASDEASYFQGSSVVVDGGYLLT